MRLAARLLPTLTLAALTLAAATSQPVAGAQDDALSVRITSPLGRTGLPGPIRIVAQVRHAPAVPPGQVRFFVDHRLLGAVDGGPPYAVEWVDDNPFERRELAVEVVDAAGNAARDEVVLEPFEILEVSQVTSVLLEAAVQDESGRFIRGLGQSGFSLCENGEPQLLEVVRQEEVGATFTLLVDSSNSMSRRMDFVQRSAASLASYLGPEDRMIVAPFSKAIGVTTGPTNDHDTIVEGIQAIRPIGGTAILDALVRVADSLRAAEGRRAIVLITDGYDEHSTSTFDEALQAVKSVQATVYVVGIGGVAGISLRGERLLRRIATETGGRAFFPSRDVELAGVHQALTDDVQNRYLITYTPTDQTPDGTWREIQLTTVDPDYVVRTRPGYFAPAPPPIRPAIEFTVLDAEGRYLDLAVEDLEVLEDGVPQEVESFQDAVLPLNIVLALDASGSMRRSEAGVMASARDFVDALRPSDSLALMMFADEAVLTHDLSTYRDGSHRAIDEYAAVGGTALYDALGDSMVRLQRVQGRRAIVVMTDGRDEDNPGTGPGSVRNFADVEKLLRDSGAIVFPIGLGSNVDVALLTKLADDSGGRAFFPAEVEGLRDEYQRVVEDLRRRYVVGYTSTNGTRDGSWRNVEIRVRSSTEAAVRSIGGYFAPEQ